MNTHSLVIGGTRGLGREVTRLFANEGHVVSVVGRNTPSDEDQRLKNTRFWVFDLSKRTAIPALLNEIVSSGGPVNNIVFLQRYKGCEDRWSGEIEVSLSITKDVIESLSDKFSSNGEKSIVIVGSIADRFISDGQPVSYHVAKAGLYQLVCYYAVVLGQKGIRVNCVSPGTLVKEENQSFYANNKPLLDLFQKTIPLGRMGTALDSANAILFLCSPKASFLTGQKIVVDGGVSLVSQEAIARKLAGL